MRWRDGRIIDLGTLPGGSFSTANDLNDLGMVVGHAYDALGDPRAVMWSGDTIVDLNTLIPADSGWVLLHANGINNAGQIVGTGKYDGQVRAFVLNPVPEPAATGLLLAVTMLLRRRRV